MNDDTALMDIGSIKQLKARYCRYLDTKDWDRWRDLVDPEQQPEPPTQLLRRVYGLTNAEADVALRVVRGDGLKPICEELSLSMATVKTHLQHVFDKTDTHRQADLVRLLLTLTP
jgi:DNA-binding CsgD family transcriptional regulator